MRGECDHYWVDVSPKWERCRKCLRWQLTPEYFGKQRQEMFKEQRRENYAKSQRRRSRQNP